jgi:hypothetical protein
MNFVQFTEPSLLVPNLVGEHRDCVIAEPRKLLRAAAGFAPVGSAAAH